MTEIDVPDWVVTHARAAVREFWENYKGGVDCGEYDAAMKAALTAALGAWVETVGFAVPESLHQSKRRMSWFDVWATPHPPFTIPLYTLRQEKPE